MIKHCELIMVDGDENHNRIFNMEQINSCQFRATWGRYGSSMSTRLYSMDVWNALRNKKLKAGYTDITNLQSVVAESKDLKYSPISDSEIESLVNKILRYASECIEQNYTIKKQDVTHSMVDSARKEIDKLSDMAIEYYQLWFVMMMQSRKKKLKSRQSLKLLVFPLVLAMSRKLEILKNCSQESRQEN